MDKKAYRVTCLNCKQSSRLNIIDNRYVMYQDQTPIIAARLRGDLKWGYECMCGNDSRLAVQEKNEASILIKGNESAVKKILDSLKIKDSNKFVMEAI